MSARYQLRMGVILQRALGYRSLSRLPRAASMWRRRSMSWCVFLFLISSSSSVLARAFTSFDAGPRNQPFSSSTGTRFKKVQTSNKNVTRHLRPLQHAVAAQAQHQTHCASRPSQRDFAISFGAKICASNNRAQKIFRNGRWRCT